MIISDLAGRIRNRLNALEITSFEAERRVNLKRSFINDILIGRKKTTSQKGLAKIAEALECDPEYLTGHQSVPRRSPSDADQGMPVSMICETGVWRPLSSVVISGTVPVLPDPRYPGVANIAARVRGDGAVLAGIRDGDVIVALDWTEWSRRFGTLRDGALCLVRRIRTELDEVEFSIRYASVEDEIVTFVAPSEAKYPDVGLAGSETEQVKLVGIVARSIREFV